ncbi:hypothetical protein AVEN_112891-1 [Araneus ventricosus]|uniref:Uncharacterized protein n=1 Tax=Araneus ventricosus TaxID=182803 RepID=A0A4Y2SMY7_ARAVE|nr:hypothetical protein AVEN_112891-1 [Araneus ventricosus]
MLSWGWVHGVPPEAGWLSFPGSPCQGLTPLRVGRLPWVSSGRGCSPIASPGFATGEGHHYTLLLYSWSYPTRRADSNATPVCHQHQWRSENKWRLENNMIIFTPVVISD